MTDRLLRQHWIITFAAVCVFVCPICVAQPSSLPHLRKQGEATQLIVEGKPFLVLGGELGNSSSSSLEYMRPVWPKLVALNLNTVLVPVYWDLIEPAEGKFDFTLVDGLIQEARKYGLRLMPLWFASWKNSMSCYAPAWVKINQQRFPRAEDRAGSGMEILSPFSSVPQELTSCLERRRDALAPELRAVWAATNFKTRGTWEEVFGPDVSTDEIFMACCALLQSRGRTRQGRICAADVCQRRAHPPGPPTRSIFERRAAATFDGRLARGRSADRFFIA
jgi:hypothetical protein